MQFDVMKRVWLFGFLPQDVPTLGDYRILHDLKMALSISEEEGRAINFHRDEANNMLRWNPDAPDKEIEVGERAEKIIKDSLKKAAKAGPINDQNIALFEMFGVEDE